jgi:hypothetical protein
MDGSVVTSNMTAEVHQSKNVHTLSESVNATQDEEDVAEKEF